LIDKWTRLQHPEDGIHAVLNTLHAILETLYAILNALCALVNF
jgi:hypothetical protein